MSSLTSFAELIVATACNLNKLVVAKNGLGTMRDALTSKRFATALLDCAYLGLGSAWKRPETSTTEPITNFSGMILLSVDKVVEDASPVGVAIRIEDLERAAENLRSQAPHIKVDPELVEQVTRYARTYAPNPAPSPGHSASAVPA